MAVTVTYLLAGSGWSDCYIAIGDHSAHLTASYLSDALGDLVRSMVDLFGDATESTAWFAEEPGEYLWRFRRVPPDRVSVRILWFDDTPTDADAEGGKVVLAAECRLRTLAGAILAAAQEVHRQHGEEGYLQRWHDHGFPTELVARLKSLLDDGAGRSE